MTYYPIKITDLAPIDGEPRIKDLELASMLDMTNVHDIRRTIERNRDEMAMHGKVSVSGTETSRNGGRPGTTYWLNEGQALVICALSRTPVAAMVRKALIDVFMAFRRGQVVDVREHYRRPPVRQSARQPLPIGADARMLSFFRAFDNQPEALSEWALSMVGGMEDALVAFTGDRGYVRSR